MKLIVAGASGFVATEIIRQALRRADVTSVVALARKPVTPPVELETATSKLKSVVLEDYGVYSDDVKKQLSGADACICSAMNMDFATVKYICQDCTTSGLGALSDAGQNKPFRFVYMSGALAERDKTKKPRFVPEYSLMRGETESHVLAFSKEHNFEVGIVRPGYILSPGRVAPPQTAEYGEIDVSEVAAALLEVAIHGFEKETYDNNDLLRVGKKVLEETTE